MLVGQNVHSFDFETIQFSERAPVRGPFLNLGSLDRGRTQNFYFDFFPPSLLLLSHYSRSSRFQKGLIDVLRLER